MEEDIKNRFESIERLIDHTEKRFDDIKWYFGGAATLFTIGFGVLTILLSWNYKSERDGLRDYERDLKVEMGKIDVPADLEILSINGLPLAGQEVVATADRDKEGWVILHLDHILKNKGGVSTGPMFIKIYANAPLNFGSRSTDESDYKYETYLYKNLDPNDLPGGVSMNYVDDFTLQKEMPSAGKYKSLIKVYYGKGKVVRAPFILILQ